MLQRSLGEDVAIETMLANELWTVAADAHQLESAILNLAVNARDAMPNGGRLTLETGNAHIDEAYVAAHNEVVAGQYVVISVSDTGVGMDGKTVAQAFEPFFTTKPVGKGTGLGLNQVYGFVKQSGGHVKIYSEVGQGITVRLYLPRLAGEASNDSAPDEMLSPEATKPFWWSRMVKTSEPSRSTASASWAIACWRLLMGRRLYGFSTFNAASISCLPMWCSRAV
jgi:hypothetical protein